MSASEYRRETTGLLVVDPYNDFLSEGGLIWPRLKEVAEEVGLRDNLRAISWGGEFHSDFVPRDGDLVVRQHWDQSGFANTDLDMPER